MHFRLLITGLLLVGLAVLAGCTAPGTPVITPPPSPPITEAPASPPPTIATPVGADLRVSPSPSLPPTPTVRPSPTSNQPAPAAIHLGRPQPLTRGELHDAVFSADGRTLFVASASGLYTHNAQTLAPTAGRLAGGYLTHLAAAPSGDYLVTVGLEGLQIISPTNIITNVLPEITGPYLRDLAFTPAGRLALLNNSDSTVTFWTPPDGPIEQKTYPLDDASRSLAVSPDGTTLALGGQNGRLELFDLERGSRLAVLSETTGQQITGLAFSPDGAYLAGARTSPDGLVQVWSVGQRKRVVEQYHLGFYGLEPFVAFSPDGSSLLAGYEDLALVWQRPGKEPVARLSGYSSRVWDMVVSPQGDQLAFTTFRWPAFVIDLPTGQAPLPGAAPARIFSLPGQEAFSVSFSPDGRTLAIGMYDYSYNAQPPLDSVRLWDSGAATAGPAADPAAGNLPPGFPGYSTAAFHPAKDRLALAGLQGDLRIVGLSGQGDQCLPGCDCNLTTGGAAGSAAPTWASPGACSVRLPHDLSASKLGFSPDGSRLAVWGVADGWSAAAVWELGQPGSPWSWFPGGSWPAFLDPAITPWIALGIDELNADHGLAARWLVVHDPLAGKDILKTPVPSAAVAAFSPDGEWLAVGLSSYSINNLSGPYPPDPQSNALQLWDVAAGRPFAAYPVPYGVTHLTFTPDGRYLITSSETGEILLWNLDR